MRSSDSETPSWQYPHKIYFDTTLVATFVYINNIVWELDAYKELCLINGVDLSLSSKFGQWLIDNCISVIDKTVQVSLVSEAHSRELSLGNYKIKAKGISQELVSSQWSNIVNYNLTSLIAQRFGLSNITDFRIGSQEVKKIYYGDELIYTCDYKPQAEAPEIEFFFDDRHIAIDKEDSAIYTLYIDGINQGKVGE